MNSQITYQRDGMLTLQAGSAVFGDPAGSQGGSMDNAGTTPLRASSAQRLRHRLPRGAAMEAIRRFLAQALAVPDHALGRPPHHLELLGLRESAVHGSLCFMDRCR